MSLREHLSDVGQAIAGVADLEGAIYDLLPGNGDAYVRSQLLMHTNFIYGHLRRAVS